MRLIPGTSSSRSSSTPSRASLGAGVASRADEKRGPGVIRRLTLPPLVLLVILNAVCIPYFMLPLASRVRHPFHDWMRPSGPIGQSLGIIAFLLFLFLWLYPVRKKLRVLAFTGSTKAWLDVHVAAGLLIPLLAATHGGWRFGGIIGLGYGAMFVVCCSGVAGRYLYMRIPRARDGLALTIDEIDARRDEMLARLAETTGLAQSVIRELLEPERRPTKGLGVIGTFRRLHSDDLRRRRSAKALAREWKRAAAEGRAPAIDRSHIRSVVRLAGRQMALAQQIKILDSTHRVFRYWHAAHRPVAVTALLAVVLHVVVVIAVGVTWFG